MTRSELVVELAQKIHITLIEAEKVVREIFDGMTDALIAEERIEIRGFGSFEIRNYKSYSGINPKTGKKVVVKPKKSPFFKVGKELRLRVLAGGEQTSQW